MRFQIKRTSHGFSQHERPCEHPTLKDETTDDQRLGDPEEYEHFWSIEIHTLDELLDLAWKSGKNVQRRGDRKPRVIIGPVKEVLGLPTLEIYDGYRE